MGGGVGMTHCTRIKKIKEKSNSHNSSRSFCLDTEPVTSASVAKAVEKSSVNRAQRAPLPGRSAPTSTAAGGVGLSLTRTGESS